MLSPWMSCGEGAGVVGQGGREVPVEGMGQHASGVASLAEHGLSRACLCPSKPANPGGKVPSILGEAGRVRSPQVLRGFQALRTATTSPLLPQQQHWLRVARALPGGGRRARAGEGGRSREGPRGEGRDLGSPR